MQDKTGYIELLLQLFRTLSIGKFETLYAIFGGATTAPPLLPPTLNLLRALLDGPSAALHRDKLLEACLIMPARCWTNARKVRLLIYGSTTTCPHLCRLSEQLAGLPRLMQPLVQAMEGRKELVTLSLRTLEYWVDSLNPEFLEPAMASVAPRLLAALASHLKPAPSPFGSKVATYWPTTENMCFPTPGKCLKTVSATRRCSCWASWGGATGAAFRSLPSWSIKTTRSMACGWCSHFSPQPASWSPSIASSSSPAMPSTTHTQVLILFCKGPIMTDDAWEIGSAGREGVAHRQHALQLIHVCLASVLNLRSPAASGLPGTPVDKLATMLFGDQVRRGSPGISVSEGNI